ncbi:MAG TPA: flagellar hook-length control protein FliK [Paucimonas sp.]|nr:flagellar hook-length control protein FliK [Paucimonas sp.]
MAIPRADIAGTRPPAAIEPPTPVTASANARQDTFHRLAQIMLGRQLQAEVLSRFGDGTFLVRVSDTPARMALPEGTRVGDNLKMTMLAHQPRPTFLLNGEPGSAQATLSSAGRLIDTILQLAQRGGADAAVRPREPLLPAATALTADDAAPRIADALRGTVTFSGLFYEAHLSDWVNGNRSLADLMREPQMRHSARTTPDLLPTAPAHSQSVPADPLQSPPSELEARLAELLRTAQPLSANSADTDADTMLPPSAKNEAAAESLRLIPLQLHALEQKQLFWQGELFPGMPMEWEVNEDTPGHEEPSRDAEPGEQTRWQSAVRFELPALGAVAASITLTGDRVQIQIRAASEAAAAALREHGQELTDAIEAAGSRLESLQVKQDEEA